MFLERIVLLNLISQLCPNDTEISKNLRLILLEFVNNYKKVPTQLQAPRVS